jgi:transcriptional regulator with PAS, ATPase and Fis domain
VIRTEASGEEFYVFTLGETWEQAKLQILTLVLKNNGGNRVHTARALGVSVRTVRHWIERYKLGRDPCST